MRHVRLGSTVAAALLAALVGCSSARTLEESASTASECARCHGFPPSAATNAPDHPAVASEATACAACHSATVDSNGEILADGAHQNGTIDVTTHPIPYVAQHTPAALDDIQFCAGCHGSDFGGGYARTSCNACHASIATSAPDWKTNCSWCHGTRTANVTSATAQAAPPQAVSGGDATSANPRVGAHQAHLSATPVKDPLPCSSCHQVPTADEALTHFEGGGARGAISFSPLAQQGVTGAAYDGTSCNVYCHGSGGSWPEGSNGRHTVPAWTGGPAEAGCGSCHGLPPTTGPTISGVPVHVFHFEDRGVPCSVCHDGATPVNTATHVNGEREAIIVPRSGGTLRINGWNCDACHDALGVF